MKEKIDALLNDSTKLPSISSVVLKVMEMVQHPDVDIAALAAEIAKDPGITASIIKLSNSAYYRQAKPIKTVQESLMNLGIKVVKEIILLTAAKGILNKNLPGYQIDAEAMWLHSIIVAELSSRIAKDKKLNIETDLAFTGGLLHDIGKVVLAQFFPGVMLQIKNELKDGKDTFDSIEKKFFGYDHQEVGAKLLKTWNFPSELIAVALFHHNPEKATKFNELVAVIHVANTITIISGIGIDIGGLTNPLSNEALKLIGITEEDLQKYYILLPEIEHQVAELITQ